MGETVYHPGVRQLLAAVALHKTDTSAYKQLGCISAALHPQYPYILFNYTPEAVYKGEWNDVERVSRGLIINYATGELVALPFPKFYNLGERPETDLLALQRKEVQGVQVTSKLDGSLGIFYRAPDGTCAIATRGSFTSEQALWATSYLREHYPFVREIGAPVTLLFEIIYPENRIVLDYGDTRALYLIGTRRLDDGYDYDYGHLLYFAETYGLPLVPIIECASLEALIPRMKSETGIEGWVARFADGTRVKLKTEEYLRLHKIITQTNARTIWEYLKDGSSLSELLDRVPDEFYGWVKATSKGLTEQHSAIQQDVTDLHDSIVGQSSISLSQTLPDHGDSLSAADLERLNRAMAKQLHQQFARRPDIAPFLHLMHTAKGKDRKARLSAAIWERLRPAATKPFKTEQEAA